MASSYPSSIDNFTRQTGTGTLSADNGLTHKDYHDNAFDGIEAVQAELGVNPSGAHATVVARLDAQDALYDYLTASATKATDTDDTSATSSLAVTLEANTTYQFELKSMWSCLITTQDLKCRFTAPAGSTFAVTGLVLPTGLAAFADIETDIANIRSIGSFSLDSSIEIGVPGSGYGVVPAPVNLQGFIFTGGNAGAFTFKWAQLTSSSNFLQFIAGSYLKAVEVS